ncbi:HetP family heterocyst commitment protein [Anabaena sp. UHCC 0204]|uniref:HetP family heterocyst commitment protein n=1 Tax=Anabaena sp. UHCC 0204 TaxID=2590009 RepID=UPI0014450720|nr:HetP family heterocyst commitment protein [Anabaena sp. UHCC 0204]MTJ10420.1 heterocyst formation protein HetP [Anabaena sp. UHCC 0204]
MNYQASSSQNDFHSAITPEQFNQIIEAIADGRYSWACVLILRCIGYNPIHYIPQHTYSRLIKENRQIIAPGTSNQQKTNSDIHASVNSSNYRDSSQLVTTAER